MLAVRSLLFYLGMWTATVLICVGLPVALLLPLPTRFRYVRLWSRFVLAWLRVTCAIDYRVEGREHIPSGAAVVLAKHQSTWETLALQQIFPPQTWVLKRELLRIPFFGWGLAATNPVAIDRAAGKEALRQVVTQGCERLEQGIWMVVFPEGTRVEPGTRGRYQVGGGMLAQRAGVPVVPVAHNAGRYWPRRGFIKKPGTITLVIGPVIETTDKKATEIVGLAEQWIEATMERLDGGTAA